MPLTEPLKGDVLADGFVGVPRELAEVASIGSCEGTAGHYCSNEKHSMLLNPM